MGIPFIQAISIGHQAAFRSIPGHILISGEGAFLDEIKFVAHNPHVRHVRH